MRNNILAILTYYDILDFPLSSEEILRYLIRTGGNNNEEVSIQNIKKNLDQLVLEEVVDTYKEYYFFKDRDYLVPLRYKKEKISQKKWVKARKAIRWLKYLPYIEAVFASGTLALNNCDELSDLDVLIVARHSRIWTARFLVSGMMSLLRVRRKWSDKIAPDKICLNHYITDKSLNIPFESIYNAQTYINLKPILTRSNSIVARFYNENKWINRYLMSDCTEIELGEIRDHNWLAKIAEFILDSWFGGWLEIKLKKYQVKRIEANPLSKSVGRQTNSHIVYSDEMLAFHPDSPEGEITKNYKSRLSLLKIEIKKDPFKVQKN